MRRGEEDFHKHIKAKFSILIRRRTGISFEAIRHEHQGIRSAGRSRGISRIRSFDTIVHVARDFLEVVFGGELFGMRFGESLLVKVIADLLEGNRGSFGRIIFTSRGDEDRQCVESKKI